jgi:hypothetical protein
VCFSTGVLGSIVAAMISLFGGEAVLCDFPKPGKGRTRLRLRFRLAAKPSPQATVYMNADDKTARRSKKASVRIGRGGKMMVEAPKLLLGNVFSDSSYGDGPTARHLQFGVFMQRRQPLVFLLTKLASNWVRVSSCVLWPD